MSSAGGLSRRRVQASVASESTSSSQHDPSTSTLGLASPASSSDVNGFGHGHAGTAMEGGNKIAYDPRDLGNDDSTAGGKMPRLTILEEVLLLGLKDKQVSILLSFCPFFTPSYDCHQLPSHFSLCYILLHLSSLCEQRLTGCHANTPSRDIFLSGTTISHMLFEDVSSSNSHCVDESPWFAILQGDVFLFPIA